jgi:hypothetical protein
MKVIVFLFSSILLLFGCEQTSNNDYSTRIAPEFDSKENNPGGDTTLVFNYLRPTSMTILGPSFMQVRH